MNVSKETDYGVAIAMAAQNKTDPSFISIQHATKALCSIADSLEAIKLQLLKR